MASQSILIKDETSEQLFRVRRTQAQMMNDRGYVADDDFTRRMDIGFLEDTLTQEEWEEAYQEKEGSLRTSQGAFYSKRMGDKVTRSQVYYYPEERPLDRAGTAPILIQASQEPEDGLEKISQLILINNSELGKSDFVVNLLSYKGLKVQLFMDTELIFNVSLHSYVPRHIGMPDGERDAFFKRYKIKDSQMPILKLSDPVVKYYDFHSRQMVRIERYNFAFTTAIQESIYYRLVE